MGNTNRLLYLGHKSIPREGYHAWFNNGRHCVWCDTCCEPVLEHESDFSGYSWIKIWGCPQCGWWTYAQFIEPMMYYKYRHYGYGVLKTLDIASDEAPLAAIREHLAKHYDDRKYISAQKAEDLVGSVLRDFYDCEVKYFRGDTNRPDGGIDLVLARREGDACTAVQVKRRVSRETESVNLVRDFVGAMVLEGFRSGIYVTTAGFTRPASKAPERQLASSLGICLDLIDGQQLLEMLNLTNVKAGAYSWASVLGALNINGMNCQHPPAPST